MGDCLSCISGCAQISFSLPAETEQIRLFVAETACVPQRGTMAGGALAQLPATHQPALHTALLNKPPKVPPANPQWYTQLRNALRAENAHTGLLS